MTVNDFSDEDMAAVGRGLMQAIAFSIAGSCPPSKSTSTPPATAIRNSPASQPTR